MLNPYLKTCLSLLGLILFLLLGGCEQYRGSTFEPNKLASLTEQELAHYANTSFVTSRIKGLKNPSQQVDSLLHIAEWMKNYDEEATLHYARCAYDIATEKNWNIPRGISANRLAWSKGKRAKYGEDVEDALVDAKISKRLLADYDDPFWEVDINNLLGYLYNRQGLADTARHYFMLALEQTPELDIEPELVQWNQAMIYHNLAATLGRADSLLEQAYYERSDSLYQIVDNWENRTRLWLDWAYFYTWQKKEDAYEKADSLLNLCLAYGGANNDQNLLARAHYRRGYLYQKRFNKSENLAHFALSVAELKKSLAIPSDNNYRTYQILGKVFQDSWAIDIEESHADSAISYFKQAMIGAREEGGIRVMEHISENLVYLYDYKDGMHKDALGVPIATFLDDNYSGVVDTITVQAKVAFGRINEVEQRDLRVSAANKRQQQLMIGIAVLLAATVLFVIFMQRLQNRRLRAEMSALRAQINPHFISNSLNAIEHLVNTGEARKASKYLVHFSRLTRQILNGSSDSLTTVGQELKTLRHFLMLEQLRFSDKLSFDIDCDSAVKKDELAIPALILQPYVENAIWHGIKPKPEGGHVSVHVELEENVLKCIIEDDGIGREAARIRKAASLLKQKSRGMDITQQRLKSMGKIKGPALQIEDMVDNNGEPAGTRVTLRLPLKNINN